jgi:hypothetical protein
MLLAISFSNMSTVDQTTSTTTKGTFIIYCQPGIAPIKMGFGNSTRYETFEVELWFFACGQQVPGARIHFDVPTAWISNSEYQRAANLSLSFEGALSWTQGGCNVAGLPTEPAISLYFVARAYYNKTENRYYAPAYAGHGELCFNYPQSYRPVFIVRFANGTMIYLHQAPSQPPYLLTITEAPTTTQTSSSTQTVTQTITEIRNGGQAWYDNPVIQTMAGILTITFFLELLFKVWKNINLVGQLWSYLRKKSRRK